MNKENFLADSCVKAFIAWSIKKLPHLKIHLQIGHSRFVPEGININATGLDDVLQNYMWKSTGIRTGDWGETVSYLNNLAKNLRNAVNSGNNETALSACNAILVWGGDRNRKVGAYPFLRDQPNLCEYILETGKTFNLKTANEASLAAPNGPVTRMNAMLTKIHALFSTDGLPIYDSRVAAAIATLIEYWRHESGQADDNLPSSLTFPATMTTRTVLNLFPSAHHSGVMTYGAAGTVMTATQWTSAKVRLGWLMEDILKQSPSLFTQEANRMHAFEAALFMIGYDVTCLDNQNIALINQAGASARNIKKLQKALSIATISISAPSNTLNTLSGRPCKEINCTGNRTDGFSIQWGNTKFFLEPSVLEELVSEFEGRENVPLGAEQSGKGPFDSLGIWLKDTHKINPRFASAIAPILVHAKIINSYKGTSPILLDFAKQDIEIE